MIKARFPDIYRRTLYGLMTTSWLSGVVFFVLSRWCMVEGDFGPMKHPLQFPVLMIHGAAAFLMIFAFGFILASHVPVTWKLKTFRVMGITLISLISCQMVTAYLLYYLSNESIRDLVANLHAAVGLSLPVILTVHILKAIKRRKAKQRSNLSY